MPRIADTDRVVGEVRRRGLVTLPVRYERERPGSWSTWTPRRSRGSRTAAAGGPAGNPSSRARHVYTRSYSPWQNGKVGRMNRIIAQEWQYGRARESEAGRADALPAFIER